MRYTVDKKKKAVHPHVQHQTEKEPGMTQARLTFIGIASIVGAGFFLATGTIFNMAGPSTLLGYALAWFSVSTIFAALGEMAADEAGKGGSFRAYAGEYLGRRVAFVGGWLYWTAGVLIMSSEVTALGLFTQRWFPSIPLWLLSAVFSLLALGLNWLGSEKFGQAESLFAVVKIAAIVGFVLVVMIVAGGMVMGGEFLPRTKDEWFPHGVRGLWSALILIYFTFGGIIATGLASGEMKEPGKIPGAFRGVVILLFILYFVPLTLVILTGSTGSLSPQQSPLITVLSRLSVPYADEILNGIMIAAAFSTMVAAMFADTRVLLSLAEDGDAPRGLLLKNRREVPTRALLASSGGLILAIGISFFLPKVVYELLSTSAGINLVLLWMGILLTHHQYRKKNGPPQEKSHPMWGYPLRTLLSCLLILLVLIGIFLDKKHLISLIFSLALIAVITLCYQLMKRKRGRGEEAS
ncbi:amino acid/polyamine/organocation transporter, APC superfamily [Marininema mesophilum]|uniref:Amino acid/polyamine/organocation transporter, APC superfamily n=1 Tax=Marininema mesophilum TaxID=1048340 RepID=A0A1H3CBL0_9BACL|nr:amino acid permease [Marininema mesophilum]SDX51430.1 amino acid/polyamine/organocation transporter, APC superfamily [Marininema mesophilum]